MSDTVKAAVIIGVCLMLGLWGAGWLNRIPEELIIKGKVMPPGVGITLRGEATDIEPIHIDLVD